MDFSMQAAARGWRPLLWPDWQQKPYVTAELWSSFQARFCISASILRPDPPTTLNVAERKRRTLVAPDMNLSLDQSEGSVLSDDFLDTPDDLDINVDDIETPDETDSLEFITNGNDLEWEGQTVELL